MKKNLDKGELVLRLRKINELTQGVLLWAERSGAAQRCLPSATGSSDARASDESGADSSVVRLTESGSAALVHIILLCEHYQNADIEGHDPESVQAEADLTVNLICKLASNAVATLASKPPTLTAQRERASQTNVKSSLAAGRTERNP